MSLDWIESSLVATWVRESAWGYPLAITSHAIGMAIVVGTIFMFDLRLLGYAKRFAISSFERLFPLAWVGFALNFASGIALFSGAPQKFLDSAAFQIKLGLILAGGLCLWFLGRSMDVDATGADPSVKTRITAALSLCFWVGAIIAGRLIAYTT